MTTSAVTSMRYVMIGTAGHIDHGKTSLVARLTNIDTDRLPEEKSRGISIDLGFACWDHDDARFGVVDVPGHEKFVRNMVAGATGINLALMVVAADDSVMPQTREHLEIMQLLGVRHGVIAVNKIDLVDEEMRELVIEEVRELVEDTFLAEAPIVPVSAITGEGLEQLKDALAQTARQADSAANFNFFRMPIDRAFSITGHGTVVTGSVLHGQIHAGETLELLPEQVPVRVRNVQSHDLDTDVAGARQRTAINLASVKPDDVTRGHELATPGALSPTRRMLVELTCLSSSPIEIRDRSTLQLHLGTGEQPVRIGLKGRTIEPGETAVCELRTNAPVVAAFGQRFIIRRTSPARTIGGGRILDPEVPPGTRTRDLEGRAAAMLDDDPAKRLDYLLQQEPFLPEDGMRMSVRAGLKPGQYDELIHRIATNGQLVELGSSDRKLRVHRQRLDALCRSTMNIIRAQIAAQQPRRSLPPTVLMTACRDLADANLIPAIFRELQNRGELVYVGHQLGPADAQAQLTRRERGWRDEIWQAIESAGPTPPTRKELSKQLETPPETVSTLCTVLVEDGLVIQIDPDLFYAVPALDHLRRQLAKQFDETDELTLSEIRSAWGVSRKYAVPLCEFFDSNQLTVRCDELRKAGPRLQQSFLARESELPSDQVD